MTEALYLIDSYQTQATAKVAVVGDNYLILDQTIFYPQGGGQPSDKGLIKTANAELHVKSVEYNGGEIKHLGTVKGSFAVGDEVELSIDWDLRLKHMQWHSAGHLVDLIVRQVYPELIPVKGTHGIGKKLYIEYQGIQELDLVKLNEELSNLVSSKPSIKTQFVTLEELKTMSNWLPEHLPTSKKLRVLSIGDTYHIPDGGTQLKTGEPIWTITITTADFSSNSTLIHYSVTEPVKDKHGEDPSLNDYISADSSESSQSNNSAEIQTQIDQVKNLFITDLNSLNSSSEVDSLYLKYLGKKGVTSDLLKRLQGLTLQDKKTYGPVLNELKKSQENAIKTKKTELEKQSNSAHGLDLTIPGTPKPFGHLHPTTTIIREMNEFFTRQGFSIGEGPEIEDVEYNFRRLNLPEGHPATDLQDSLFIQEPNLLLRTHTSSIQTRVLSNYKPPLRVVVPGKCYRNETTNSTNSAFFYQYQGFVVDKGVTIGHLKDMLTRLHQFLFGSDVKLRFRYKYYPEVSPGMGVDMQCRFCRGTGCQVCKYRGWIETLGSGMTHYNCYKSCGIDPEIYTGYSFGLGLDRLVMSKYGIKDIRKLYGGEIVYK